MGAEAQPVGDDDVPGLTVERAQQVIALIGAGADEQVLDIQEHLPRALPPAQFGKGRGEVVLIEVGCGLPRHDPGAERFEPAGVCGSRVDPDRVSGLEEGLCHGRHRRHVPVERHDRDHHLDHGSSHHTGSRRGAPRTGVTPAPH